MTSINTSLLSWKKYVILTTETILTFYLASFCLAMFYIHHGPAWLLEGILLTTLYFFTIFAGLKRVYQQVPIEGLMLAIPLIPLIALFIVISLIPVIQIF